MKTTALIFSLFFIASGGLLTGTFFDVSFMNITICHSDIEVNKWQADKMLDNKGFLDGHSHLEVHVLKALPHMLHGDKLFCHAKSHE